MPNFDTLITHSAGAAIIKNATPKDAAINADYLNGDHFRKGREWIGPPPPPDQILAAMTELAKVWCPVPVIEEMVDGHVMGAVGREPAIEYAPKKVLKEGDEYSDDEKNALSEINTQFGNWWDNRNGHEIVQAWVSKLRSSSRATFRLFVPPDLMKEDGDGTFQLDVDEVPDALSSIYVEVPDADAATVYTDRRSMRDCGIYSYDETDEKGKKTKRLELVFVADDNQQGSDGRDPITKDQTVIRIIEGDKVLRELAFDCGGQSLMYEGKAPLLITEPVRRSQRALNMINTMLPLNAAYAGFRSKEYFNVTEQTDPDTGEETEVTTGPAQALMWYSKPYKDENNETKYFPPQMIVVEPIKTDSLRADITHFDRIIRRSCKQEHTLFEGGNNVVAAVALIQMRSRFANDLLRTTPVVEGALRWMQVAVYCFALYLCGKESEIEAFLGTYRATARCKPYTGPLTPDEIRVLIELYKEGLMPRETCMVLFGVEDVDGEVAKLEAEQGNNLDMQIKRAELFEIWAQTFDTMDAAELADLPENLVAKIAKMRGGVPDALAA